MPDIQAAIDALWDWADPAESERRFRQAGDGPVMRTQLARALGLQRKFDDAHAVLDAVEFADDVSPAVLARCKLERGRLFNDARRIEEARVNFMLAEDIARQVREDCLRVDALHMLAIIAPAEEALVWHRQAIDAAERSEDPRTRRWRASLLNNYGWTQFDLGRHDEALAALEEALRLRQEMGQPGPIRIARFCVAKVKRVLGRVEEALAEQQRLMDEQAGESDGYGDEEIGECLRALGRAAEARAHFAVAYDRLSKDPWLAEREPQRIERLKQLAGGAA